MSLREEFKAFVLRGNVIDLAVAVVIGGAFGKIVTAFVEGIVMPLVGFVLPAKGPWQSFMVGPFAVGRVLGEVVSFLAIAGVIFLILVKGLGALSKLKKKEEAEAAPEAPATKTCPECLETVPAAAKRCRHCTSVLA